MIYFSIQDSVKNFKSLLSYVKRWSLIDDVLFLTSKNKNLVTFFILL